MTGVECEIYQCNVNFFTFYGLITFSSNVFKLMYTTFEYIFSNQSDPRTGPTPVTQTEPEAHLESEADLEPNLESEPDLQSEAESEPDLESEADLESEPESEPDVGPYIDDPSYIPKPDKKWNLRKRRRINSI
jgi:hypothetical protein